MLYSYTHFSKTAFKSEPGHMTTRPSQSLRSGTCRSSTAEWEQRSWLLANSAFCWRFNGVPLFRCNKCPSVLTGNVTSSCALWNCYRCARRKKKLHFFTCKFVYFNIDWFKWRTLKASGQINPDPRVLLINLLKWTKQQLKLEESSFCKIASFIFGI